MSSFEWPPVNGGAGGGVTSLNTLTGDVTLVAGSNVTLTPSGNNITIASAGGASGVTSINSDTAFAQTLSVGTAGTNFAIVDAGSGSHVFNLPTASASNRGALSSADWATFNSKQNALTIGNLTDAGTDGIVVTGGTGAVIGSGTSLAQHVADTSHNGYLSSTDWTTFNGKQDSLTIGNLTDVGTDGITVTNGIGAVIGTGTIIAQHVADTTHSGYLSSADWNTFNSKQSSPLTGDVTTSGAVATLATVNSNVGTFGSSAAIPNFTVNGKGLITAAGTSAVVAPAGTLTGSTLASGVTSSSLTSVGTIATGVWNGTAVDVPHGGTGDSAFTAYTPICGGTTTTGALQSVAGLGNSGQVLTSNGPGALPTFQSVASGSLNYYSGYMPGGTSWSTGSATFADPTNSGSNTLTSRVSSGITVTAAASNLPGITFTPPSSSAVYIVTATMCVESGNTGDGVAVQLTDGTNVLAASSYVQNPSTTIGYSNVTITGAYAPATTSAVTVKVQIAAVGGNAFIKNNGGVTGSSVIDWTVLRIV